MESKKYLVFNDELHTMSQYASQSEVASRLGIAETQQNQLIEYQKQFESDMRLYNNPATKTVVITKQVGEHYKTTHAWIADFRQAVKHSNKGTLTESDYASLYIHKDKVRSKHTIPDTAPTLELEHIEHLNARVSAHHHASHDKGTKPRLPDGVDMIDWQWIVLDEKTIPDAVVYTHHINTHAATLKIEFSAEQMGKFCHLTARYGINNGQMGTESPIFSFVIT